MSAKWIHSMAQRLKRQRLFTNCSAGGGDEGSRGRGGGMQPVSVKPQFLCIAHINPRFRGPRHLAQPLKI